jgi:hypothetical protein
VDCFVLSESSFPKAERKKWRADTRISMQVRKEASELDIIIDIFICLCWSVRVADMSVYPAAGKDKNKLITNRAEWAGITVDKVNRWHKLLLIAAVRFAHQKLAGTQPSMQSRSYPFLTYLSHRNRTTMIREIRTR